MNEAVEILRMPVDSLSSRLVRGRNALSAFAGDGYARLSSIGSDGMALDPTALSEAFTLHVRTGPSVRLVIIDDRCAGATVLIARTASLLNSGVYRALTTTLIPAIPLLNGIISQGKSQAEASSS